MLGPKDAAGNVSQNLSAPVTITGSSTAEDMTLWIGKWFKVTETEHGIPFRLLGPINKSNRAYIGYLKFYEWDPANKILRGDRYGLDHRRSVDFGAFDPPLPRWK